MKDDRTEARLRRVEVLLDALVDAVALRPNFGKVLLTSGYSPEEIQGVSDFTVSLMALSPELVTKEIALAAFKRHVPKGTEKELRAFLEALWADGWHGTTVRAFLDVLQ